jgi:hypothetical protein
MRTTEAFGKTLVPRRHPQSVARRKRRRKPGRRREAFVALTVP